MQIYFALFLFSGVLGWGIDAFYRSAIDKKWVSGTKIPGFSPTYACGAMILLFLVPILSPLFWMYKLIGYAIILSALEFMSGLFCVYIMKKKFWNYSKNFMNLNGHTDILHAFYWGILGIAFELLLYPIFDNLI